MPHTLAEHVCRVTFISLWANSRFPFSDCLSSVCLMSSWITQHKRSNTLGRAADSSNMWPEHTTQHCSHNTVVQNKHWTEISTINSYSTYNSDLCSTSCKHIQPQASEFVSMTHQSQVIDSSTKRASKAQRFSHSNLDSNSSPIWHSVTSQAMEF